MKLTHAEQTYMKTPTLDNLKAVASEDETVAMALRKYMAYYRSLVRLEADGCQVLDAKDDPIVYAAMSFGLKVEDLDNV